MASGYVNIVAWVDSNPDAISRYSKYYNLVTDPASIGNEVLVVIAVAKKSQADEISRSLLKKPRP